MSNYRVPRMLLNASGGTSGMDLIDTDVWVASGLIPVFPTTLATQTIAAGNGAHVYGTLTVPSGVTLTVNGILYVDSRSTVTL